MINTTNLLVQKMNIRQPEGTEAKQSVVVVDSKKTSSTAVASYLNNLAMINTPIVKQADKKPPIDYKNNLKSMFYNQEAHILAIIPRTFNAKDTNKNEYIDKKEEHGTFLNAIERLDEVKSQGFNTLHILPIHPPGKQKAMGTAGSLYSPKGFLEIDKNLADPRDPRSAKEQFKNFVDECHRRDIKVMLDLPSCSSYDMFFTHPKLMAKERDGLAKTPQGWNDIRMFQPFHDESKRTLNPELLKLHKDYIDMCVDLGVDGIRADVARAKPTEFWDIMIPYSHKRDPEFAWLGENYTYEDASPQANMPFDRPADSLNAGFDSVYGQYHIFHEWNKASEFTDYVVEQLEMSNELPKGKSLIGSFATHDDVSAMFHGGADYCNLTMGMQATLPMLNPYIVDGYQSGDYYMYPYGNKHNNITQTDNHEMTVHNGRLDIFNFSRKPGGKQPEIGRFMQQAFEMRSEHQDMISKGSFIVLDKVGDKNDDIIAFARHQQGKTLLVVANKNVNRSIAGVIKVPTLKAEQDLTNLLPSYGTESILQAADDELRVDLGAARVHVFEIDTPEIEQNSTKVYKQNL
ncbi:MAG: hypothetical protein R3Y28_08165 [Candidatus Gastranaerophilales bacterium]